MQGFNREQFEVDTVHDPARYWQVIDRTTGTTLDPACWTFAEERGTVTITGIAPWHLYTVNFLVYQVWESTSMYNYITNKWTGPHAIGVDPYQPETGQHLLAYLDRWLQEHPLTDVVRFTSVAYQFPIVKDDQQRTLFQDWCAYMDCTSARAMDEFEKKKGYRLKAEDLVDAGYYNATDRIPSPAYRDWIDFVNEFTTGFTRDWVRKVHEAGKRAIMFFCDHWIGTEPYGQRFASMGFDGLVNPCINGTELRRIADVPHDITKEARLYPYFFPVNLKNEPLFQEGGDPVGECGRYWTAVRRAMLRSCVDRIGFGGYLDLAVKYPAFLDAVTTVAQEFREIVEHADKGPAWSMPGTVLVLNAWGALRSWMQGEAWPEGGFMEALSGLPVEVRFASFDDLKRDGIPEGTALIVNYGAAGSSWSGGPCWTDPHLVEMIRAFVSGGGGLVGVGEPTAVEHQGRFYQLEDVLGVQKKTPARSRCNVVVEPARPPSHFITEDLPGPPDLGRVADSVFAVHPEVEVLAESEGSVSLAASRFGQGRSVFLGGFKLSPDNTRLVLRALHWAAHQERSYPTWSTTNPNTECAAFEHAATCAVMNNSGEPQETILHDGRERPHRLSLKPFELKWVDVERPPR
jgi:1,3-beta-galactosyl-N-acetylhexosamine phosphorylase